MYKTNNVLRNQLDLNLAEKLIQMFIVYANEKNDVNTQIAELGSTEFGSLSEETRMVKFHYTGKTLDIIFRCVVQSVRVKDPVEFGCPDFLQQRVTEINFQSKNKKLVDTMQRRFEEFFDRKNKDIPEKISACISFNGKDK